jgi:hypothetical protein
MDKHEPAKDSPGERVAPSVQPGAMPSDHYVEARLPGQPEVAEHLAQLAAKPAQIRKVALLVAHGMGSQVPFQTLQDITYEIRKHRYGNANRQIPVTVALADLNGTVLPRTEMTLRDDDGAEIDLHVYEAYWAPLTEGKVTARDAIWFLFMAGLRGINRAGVKGKFNRWMFRDWQSFRIHHIRLFLAFVVAVLVVASLFGMNAAVVALTAKSFASPSKLLPVVTSDLWSFEWQAILCLSIGIGIPMLIRSRRMKAGKMFELSGLVKYFLNFWVFLAVALTIWSGAGMALHVGTRGAASLPSIGEKLTTCVGGIVRGVFACIPAGMLRWIGGEYVLLSEVLRSLYDRLAAFLVPANAAGQPTLSQLLVLGIAVAIAYVGRWFLREYVGDVAVYISSYTVSQFDALRDQIQKAALDVFLPVYQQETEKSKARRAEQVKKGEKKAEIEFEYEEIVVAGHSLGSVIGYDTINALINLPKEKLPDGISLDVPARTKAFITFGSPMDKTAFIFRTQRPEENEVRESLAATKQPMILDYRFRPRRWVNIYAPDDWIGGSLEYYDPPEAHDKTGSRTLPKSEAETRQLEKRGLLPKDLKKVVKNIPDPEGCIPLAAHVFYWKSRILQEELWQAIVSNPSQNTP